MPLRHIGWLAGALLIVIVVHVVAGEVNPLASAALTGALILTWLAAAAQRAGGPPRPRWAGAVRDRLSSADSRATPRGGDRDGPDNNGFCPA